MKRIKKIMPLICLFYFIMLFYIVLFTPARLAHRIDAPSRLIPVKDSIEELIHPPKYYIPSYYLHFTINLFGNILLFIPFGLLLSFYSENNFLNKRSILIAAFAVSLSIELSQLIFHLGVFDVDDILLNVLGAWYGILIFARIKGFGQKK